MREFIHTFFSDSDLRFIVAGVLLLLISIYLFIREQKRAALYMVILTGLVLRIWMAFIDPYLHNWDEQFHALVAKNLSRHFFEPTLYEHAYRNANDGNWTLTHFWLHKPPLFLWQMAVSMKMFGYNYFAVRFPSVILSTLTIPSVYRMGKLLINERVASLAAVFLAVSAIHLHTVSGALNTDHNDVVFMCYVTFSLWSFTEYAVSGRRIFLVLTGVFSGMAILVKWLTGAMVFGAWGTMLITDKAKRTQRKEWMKMFAAILITVLIAVPWFLYAAMKWPGEFAAFNAENSRHISDNISNHSGKWNYHFILMYDQYRRLCWFFLPGMVLLFLRSRERSVVTGLITVTVVVFVFFSIVRTRMPLFTFPVSPILILSFACCADLFLSLLPVKGQLQRPAFFTIIFLLAWTFFHLSFLEQFHSSRDWVKVERETRMHNTSVYPAIEEMTGKGEAVIYNFPAFNDIAFMFTSEKTAYRGLPEGDEIDRICRENIPVYVIDDGKLPDQIVNDKRVRIIDPPLIRNDY